MTHDPADPDEFHLYYPVFILGSEDGGVSRLSAPGVEWLPVFTDRDLADRFVEVGRFAGLAPRAVESPEELRPVVTAAGDDGTTHVVIDPAAAGGTKARAYALSDFLATLDYDPD